MNPHDAIKVNINERALIIKSWYDATASSDTRGTQRKSKYKTSHDVSSRWLLNSKRISVYLGKGTYLKWICKAHLVLFLGQRSTPMLFYYHSVPILDLGYYVNWYSISSSTSKHITVASTTAFATIVTALWSSNQSLEYFIGVLLPPLLLLLQGPRGTWTRLLLSSIMN